MQLTVAICTYNGANRLPEVLQALAAQVETETIAWEVCVIDNNSDDDTAAIVAHYAQAWQAIEHLPPLRYEFEPRQGTTYARQRAFRIAHGEWVALLDDDNWAALDWVAQVQQFIEASRSQRPQLGAFGGNIVPQLDSEPPDYFPAIAIRLAVYQRGDRPFCYDRRAKIRLVPAAPGSVIRKQAWLETVPTRHLILGGRDERHGSGIGACEDLEALYYLQNSPWEIWHAPQLKVYHHLPPHRLRPAYLYKIAYTAGLSNHALRLARWGALGWKRWGLLPIVGLYFCADGIKFLGFSWQHRSHLWVALTTRQAFTRHPSPRQPSTSTPNSSHSPSYPPGHPPSYPPGHPHLNTALLNTPRFRQTVPIVCEFYDRLGRWLSPLRLFYSSGLTQTSKI